MKRIFLFIGGGIVVVALAIYGLRARSAAQDKAALDAELQLARKEGIPTTWKEFAAGIKTSKPEENAAPIYRQLLDKRFDGTSDPGTVDYPLMLHPNETNLAAAKDFLSRHKEELELTDKAAALPSCWFDRDWSQGMAVLFSEFAPMKRASKYVALRGTIDAVERHPEEAIRQVREALRIGDDTGEDKTAIASLVKLSIYQIAYRHLAEWSFVHRDEPAYEKELDRVVRAWPKPDLQWMHREDLVGTLDLIQLCSTPEGRAKLGLKEEDVSKLEPVMGLLESQPKAKVKIAKAEREIWEAYAVPPAQREAKIGPAEQDLATAFAAFPTAAQLLGLLSGGDDNSDLLDQTVEAQKRAYTVLARALAGPTIPKSLDTTDLVSPFDGKPIEYRYDGRQITITVSSPEGQKVIPIKIPTDDQLGLKRR